MNIRSAQERRKSVREGPLFYMIALFSSNVPTKTQDFLNCFICDICLAHFSRLDLRFLIMLGEEYNARTFAHQCVTFSILL